MRGTKDIYMTGVDPGFRFRGGAKDYVRAHTSRAQNPLYGRGQGLLKGPGSSRVFDDL